MEYSQKSALLTQVESEAHQGCATDSTLLYSVVVNKFAWQAKDPQFDPRRETNPFRDVSGRKWKSSKSNMRSNLLWEQSSFYVGKKELVTNCIFGWNTTLSLHGSWYRKKVQVTLFFLTAWMCFSGFLLKTQSRRGRLQKQKEGK